MRRLTKHLTPALAAVAVLGAAGVAAAAPNLAPVIDPSTDPASTNPLAVGKWYVATTAAPYSAHFFYGAAVSNTGTDDFAIQAKVNTTVGDTATAQQVIGVTTTDLDPAKVAVKSIGAPNPGHTNWGVTNVFSIALTPSGGAPITSAGNDFCWASGGLYTTATCSTANNL
ncbi:MAG TPA: hypothetical protein VFG74_14475, partial [Miltoncostaeaceae bacterium]|nr:hypothetical protein [Miltoncostaeaceae bacterium]